MRIPIGALEGCLVSCIEGEVPMEAGSLSRINVAASIDVDISFALRIQTCHPSVVSQLRPTKIMNSFSNHYNFNYYSPPWLMMAHHTLLMKQWEQWLILRSGRDTWTKFISYHIINRDLRYDEKNSKVGTERVSCFCVFLSNHHSIQSTLWAFPSQFNLIIPHLS